MSSVRMMTWSTKPPTYPDSNPNTSPVPTAKNTATKVISSVVRPPMMSRLNTSRPIESVPSQCAALGPASESGEVADEL